MSRARTLPAARHQVLRTDEAFAAAMWERKCAMLDHFAHAELVSDVDRPDLGIFIKAGTTVLVTMISRFGDVGIRATSIDDVRHGYSVRVMPERLRNYRWAAASSDPPEKTNVAWPQFVIVNPTPQERPKRSTGAECSRKGQRPRGRR
jgi:hypothetical protein